MNGTKWLAVILVFVVGGWMVFDGLTALLRGDYITPSEGEYAGQLGPWADVLRSAGLEPRSNVIKIGFVVYGFLFLASVVLLIAEVSWARTTVIIIAVLGLWYIPFGTAINAVVIVLVWRMHP